MLLDLVKWYLSRKGYSMHTHATMHEAAQMVFNCGRMIGERETAEKMANLMRGMGIDVQVMSVEEAKAMSERYQATVN